MGMSIRPTMPPRGVAPRMRSADTWRSIAGGELDERTDVAGLEEAFVQCAAMYSHHKGISYRDWRQAGVACAVLTRARILEFDH